MEPISITVLITTVIPFVTALVKKVTKTDKLESKTKKGVNALIPLVLGIFSSGIYSYSQNGDLITALVVGLGSGGVASSARDIEKNLVRIVEATGNLIKRKKESV